MSVRNNERKTQWASQIEAWQASGLSARRFCKDNALPYSRFLYWANKRQPPAVSASASGFARVVPLLNPSAPTGLYITLPSGVRISGIDMDNVELLHRVLGQL
jgi:hypothetical protein